MQESDILEAVNRLMQAETDFLEERHKVGKILIEAATTYNVTELSRMTGMNRPKIYWLMEKCRKNENYDRNH
jgi:hypothetical protein